MPSRINDLEMLGGGGMFSSYMEAEPVADTSAGDQAFLDDVIKYNEYHDAYNAPDVIRFEDEDLKTGAHSAQKTGLVTGYDPEKLSAEDAKRKINSSFELNNPDLNSELFRVMNKGNNNDQFVDLGLGNYLHNADLMNSAGRGTSVGEWMQDPEADVDAFKDKLAPALGAILQGVGTVTGVAPLAAAGAGLKSWGQDGSIGDIFASAAAGYGGAGIGGTAASIAEGGLTLGNAYALASQVETVADIADIKGDEETSIVDEIFPEFAWQMPDVSDVLGDVQVQVPDFSIPQQDAGGGGEASQAVETVTAEEAAPDTSDPIGDAERNWVYQGGDIFVDQRSGEQVIQEGTGDEYVVGETYSRGDGGLADEIEVAAVEEEEDGLGGIPWWMADSTDDSMDGGFTEADLPTVAATTTPTESEIDDNLADYYSRNPTAPGAEDYGYPGAGESVADTGGTGGGTGAGTGTGAGDGTGEGDGTEEGEGDVVAQVASELSEPEQAKMLGLFKMPWLKRLPHQQQLIVANAAAQQIRSRG